MSFNGNELPVIDMLAKEVGFKFKNYSGLTKYANHMYESEFNGTIGDTLRIPTPARVVAGDGRVATSQAYVEPTENLAVVQQKHVFLEFTSSQLTLNFKDFSRVVIDPAAKALANKFDVAIWEAARSTFGYTGDTISSINSLSRINDGLAQMRLYSMDTESDLYCALGIRDYNELTNSLQPGFNQYAGGPATKNGELPMMMNGVNLCKGNNNAPSFVAGTGTASATAVINGAGQSGNTLNINGLTPGQTFKIGDRGEIDGVIAANRLSYQSVGIKQQFAITQDAVVDGAGAVSIQITPAIEDDSSASPGEQTVVALPANGASVTFIGDHQEGIIFNKDAITVAVVPMSGVPAGAGAKSHIVKDKDANLSFRVSQGYSMVQDVIQLRFDILFGVHVFNNAAVPLISKPMLTA